MASRVRGSALEGVKFIPKSGFGDCRATQKQNDTGRGSGTKGKVFGWSVVVHLEYLGSVRAIQLVDYFLQCV